MNWLEMLKREVESRSKQAVAEELEVSRTTVSLAVRDKYPASTDALEKKVLERYSVVQCPFLDKEITTKECGKYHNAKAPTSSPRAMRHWRACQSCAHNKEAQHG